MISSSALGFRVSKRFYAGCFHVAQPFDVAAERHHRHPKVGTSLPYRANQFATHLRDRCKDSSTRARTLLITWITPLLARTSVMTIDALIEVEAAALAAIRRTDQNLTNIEAALKAIQAEMNQGRDAVIADFQFHTEIARASQNPHFADLMSSMGTSIIPRARLEGASKIPLDQDALTYLNKVNAEHESIFAAIQGQDPEAARAAMRIHLSNSKDRRRQQLS